MRVNAAATALSGVYLVPTQLRYITGFKSAVEAVLSQFRLPSFYVRASFLLNWTD